MCQSSDYHGGCYLYWLESGTNSPLRVMVGGAPWRKQPYIRGNESVVMLLELLSDSSEKPGWLATERCDSQKGGQFLPLQLHSVQVFSPLLGKAWSSYGSAVESKNWTQNKEELESWSSLDISAHFHHHNDCK